MSDDVKKDVSIEVSTDVSTEVKEVNGFEIIQIEPNEKTYLGKNGGSLVKTTEDGVVESIIQKVKLYESKQHFYKNTQNQQYEITFRGFQEIVKYTDLIALKIDYMIMNGIKVPNPYTVQRDGIIKTVIEEVTVMGRDRSGKLAFSRARVIADYDEIFVRMVLKKAETDKELGKLCERRHYEKHRDNGENVFFFPTYTTQIGTEELIMGYMMYLDNARAHTIMKDFKISVEHEYKKVNSKAFRNAVKNHAAIGNGNVQPQNVQGVGLAAQFELIRWMRPYSEEEVAIIKKYRHAEVPDKDVDVTETKNADDFDRDVTEMDPEDIVDIEEDDLEVIDEDVEAEEKTEMLRRITKMMSKLDGRKALGIKKQYVGDEAIEDSPVFVLSGLMDALKEEIINEQDRIN